MTINYGFLFNLQKHWKVNHLSLFQPTPNIGFESVVKVQVCHFIDPNFRIMVDEFMVTLDFHVINLHKNWWYLMPYDIYLAFAFILPKAEYPWLNCIWGLSSDGAGFYLLKRLVNHFIFYIKGKKCIQWSSWHREGMLWLHLCVRLETEAVGCVGFYIKL